MNFRRRTQAEIDESVKNDDCTGGYEFFPWLLWMRPMYVVGMLGNFIAGLCMLRIGIIDCDWIGYVAGSFFAGAGILICFLLIRDYRESKVGKTR